MMKHILKTDPIVFAAVFDGSKTYEIRFNDRDFQVGDELSLLETEFSGCDMKVGKPLRFTGREITKTISHTLVGYGLMPGWAILSFAHAPAISPPTTLANE